MYILLIFDIVVSVFVFLSVALSNSSSIFATVESSNVFWAFISIIFPWLMLPDRTWSCSFISTSSDSPVSADVSSNVVPLITIESTGIFSPFLTTSKSFIFICSTGMLIIWLFSFLLAMGCFISIRSLIDFLELFIAFSSSSFPIVYNVITIAPSSTSPIKSAPSEEIVISAFSFIVLLFISSFIAFIVVL